VACPGARCRIEGLRAIAAMMVLVLHCAQITGAEGVLTGPVGPVVANLHAASRCSSP
jgi:peptidoglycan/LPS O-acetylase OafA/YrhL